MFSMVILVVTTCCFFLHKNAHTKVTTAASGLQSPYKADQLLLLHTADLYNHFWNKLIHCRVWSRNLYHAITQNVCHDIVYTIKHMCEELKPGHFPSSFFGQLEMKLEHVTIPQPLAFLFLNFRSGNETIAISLLCT